MKFLGVILIALFAFSCEAVLVDPNRLAYWTNSGVVGGMQVTRSGPVLATIHTNTANPGATVNAILAANNTGGVINFDAGTFIMDTGIQWASSAAHGNSITLRGAGTNSVLDYRNVSLSSAAYILIQGSTYFDMRPADVDGSKNIAVISPITKGTTSFTWAYSDGSAPSAGQIVYLDQVMNSNDITPIGWAESTPAHSMLERGNDPAGYRVQLQAFTIATIVSNQFVTTFEPVYMTNWNQLYSPMMFWAINQTASNIGIENFTIIANTNDSVGAVVQMNWAANCWASNVVTLYGGLAQHFEFGADKNICIQHCVMKGSRSGGSDSYGIDNNQTFDSQFVDNVCDGVTTPFFTDCGSAGNVLAYNLVTNVGYSAGGPTYFAAGIGLGHGAHPSMNLYEGNIAVGFVSDNVHGSSSDQTLFRNYSAGYVSGTSQQNYAVDFNAHAERGNIIGNVLGTSPQYLYFMDAFPTNPGSSIGNQTNFTIYRMGWYGNYDLQNGTAYGFGSTTNDGAVASNAYLHGNFDYATGTTKWNPTNADHSLPNSLFLSAKPSWWGTNAFPAIGPDLTPMVGLIPAQTWYYTTNGSGWGTNTTVSFTGNHSFTGNVKISIN